MWKIGLVGIPYGVANVCSSLANGYIVKYIGRIPVFIFGICVSKMFMYPSPMYGLPCHCKVCSLLLNKLCARPHNMPRPCTPHAAAHLQSIVHTVTHYACGAQRALLPVAVGAMNIYDIRDRHRRRQTDVSHASFYNAPWAGYNNTNDYTVAAPTFNICLSGPFVR